MYRGLIWGSAMRRMTSVGLRFVAKALMTATIPLTFTLPIPAKGLMIFKIDKSRDVNEVRDRIFPCEVGWQSFLLAARLEKTEAPVLKGIIWSFVVEEQTKTILNRATAHFGSRFRRQEREFYPGDPAFYAILGSVLGILTMRMLTDHKRIIGYRTVVKVVLFGHDPAKVFERSNARSVMIVLSEPRIQNPIPTAALTRITMT